MIECEIRGMSISELLSRLGIFHSVFNREDLWTHRRMSPFLKKTWSSFESTFATHLFVFGIDYPTIIAIFTEHDGLENIANLVVHIKTTGWKDPSKFEEDIFKVFRTTIEGPLIGRYIFNCPNCDARYSFTLDPRNDDGLVRCQNCDRWFSEGLEGPDTLDEASEIIVTYDRKKSKFRLRGTRIPRYILICPNCRAQYTYSKDPRREDGRVKCQNCDEWVLEGLKENKP